MSSEKPTRKRHFALTMAVAVAVLLYVDRYCLSTADRYIKSDLNLSEEQMADLLAAFFLTYALFQIPFGYLSDRFGPRRTLTGLMIAWSACTGLLGLAFGYRDFYAYRLGCGLFEAGAYPGCASIVKRWIPSTQRGFASGMVSFGGRLGGAITPMLTAAMLTAFAVLTPQFLSWRPTLVTFGLAGILLGVIFWLFYRDNPADDPACNAAEQALILGEPPPADPHAITAKVTANAKPAADVPFSFWSLLLSLWTNGNLWISSLIQFGANFGQVFVYTNLNRYLTEVQGITDDITRGAMISSTILPCLPALLLGGWLTDYLVRRIGLRAGIVLPLALPRLVSAGFFALVPFVMAAWPLAPGESGVARAWLIIGLLAAAQFMADFTLPAIWAFNLAVGGRVVGIVLGWGNMWGNLGGYRSPKDIQQIVKTLGWDAVFFTVAIIFVISAVASLSLDARDKLKEA